MSGIQRSADSEIQSNIHEQSKSQSDWQGPKQRSFIKSARVPFATFHSNLSSGLNCWDHSHMGCEPVTSMHGLCHDKKSEPESFADKPGIEQEINHPIAPANDYS